MEENRIDLDERGNSDATEALSNEVSRLQDEIYEDLHVLDNEDATNLVYEFKWFVEKLSQCDKKSQYEILSHGRKIIEYNLRQQRITEKQIEMGTRAQIFIFGLSILGMIFGYVISTNENGMDHGTAIILASLGVIGVAEIARRIRVFTGLGEDKKAKSK